MQIFVQVKKTDEYYAHTGLGKALTWQFFRPVSLSVAHSGTVSVSLYRTSRVSTYASPIAGNIPLLFFRGVLPILV